MHITSWLCSGLVGAFLALRTIQVIKRTDQITDGSLDYSKQILISRKTFSDYSRIYKILTSYIESKLPDTLNKVVDYLTSPGAVLPLLLLLVLFIYYLLSMVGSLKEANKDLKSQIRKDKDVSEITNVINPPEILTEPPSEKKHVRIKEDVVTDSDKAKLIQSRVNSTESNN